MRPTFEDTLLAVAKVLSHRATCLRRKVGVVITDQRNRIVGCGYNGSPASLPHCLEAGCIIVDDHCTRIVHADINAILNAPDPSLLREGTMYIWGATPCYRCAQAIISVGIKTVICVSPDIYEDRAWLYLQSLIDARRLPLPRTEV